MPNLICGKTVVGRNYNSTRDNKAPDESTGDKVIVKNYRTRNLTTGQVTDDGCFIKEKVASTIVVEDESEYKVVEWKTSSTQSSITSIMWPVPSTVTQSGKKIGLVELKKPTEKVLYVLLEKTEEDDEELLDGIDYIIEQSQVSKMVHISEAETNTDAKTIKEYEFNWLMPKLKDECSGHDYISEYNAEVKDDAGNVIGHEDKHDTAYCTDWEITDSTINVGLKNSLRLDYPEILSDSWYKNPTHDGDEVETLDYDREQDFSEHYFETTGS